MIEKPKRYYKFLRLDNGLIKSEHGSQTWKVGQEYSVQGKLDRCNNGFHASVRVLDALGYVQGDVLAIVEAWGDSKISSDKVCYRSMKIVKAYTWTREDTISVALYAAEQTIKIYENKYPSDTRPRDAIKAAKAYLKDPCKKKQDAAADVAYVAASVAANAAADVAHVAAYVAANAAADVAHVAAYVAAYVAASVAADVAYVAASVAASVAANAAADVAHVAAYVAANVAARQEMIDKIDRFINRRIKKLHEVM